MASQLLSLQNTLSTAEIFDQLFHNHGGFSISRKLSRRFGPHPDSSVLIFLFLSSFPLACASLISQRLIPRPTTNWRGRARRRWGSPFFTCPGDEGSRHPTARVTSYPSMRASESRLFGTLCPADAVSCRTKPGTGIEKDRSVWHQERIPRICIISVQFSNLSVIKVKPRHHVFEPALALSTDTPPTFTSKKLRAFACPLVFDLYFRLIAPALNP